MTGLIFGFLLISYVVSVLWRKRHIGSNQKYNLNDGDKQEGARKAGQHKGEESGRVVPSFTPNNLQRLPEGFGWLLLFGGFFGMLCVCGLLGVVPVSYGELVEHF